MSALAPYCCKLNVFSFLQIIPDTNIRTLQNTCKRGIDMVQWEIKDAPHINYN